MYDETLLEMAVLGALPGVHAIWESQDRTVVVDKGRHDGVVTRLDTCVGEHVRKFLEREAGDVPLISEEMVSPPDELPDTCFVLDEWDGSENGRRRNPECGIALAYVVDRMVIAGVMSLPFEDVFIRAGPKFGQCTRNGITVKLADYTDTDFLMVGTDARSPLALASMPQTVLERIGGLRSNFSCVASIADFLRGYTDVYWVPKGGKPWDFLAGVAAVEYAGGVVRDPDNLPFRVEMDPSMGILMARSEQTASLFTTAS